MMWRASRLLMYHWTDWIDQRNQLDVTIAEFLLCVGFLLSRVVAARASPIIYLQQVKPYQIRSGQGVDGLQRDGLCRSAVLTLIVMLSGDDQDSCLAPQKLIKGNVQTLVMIMLHELLDGKCLHAFQVFYCLFPHQIH